MRFHPLNISFLQKRIYGNNIIQSKKEDLQDEDTIALISFTPEKKNTENESTLYVGDIFYWVEEAIYIIFSLNKEHPRYVGIDSFGFYRLSGIYIENKWEYYPIDFKSYDDFFKGKNEKITLEYIGNMFIHEDIVSLFKKDIKRERYEINMFYNETMGKENTFYKNNFRFVIFDDDIQTLEMLFNNTKCWEYFDELDKEFLWHLEKNDWNISIQSTVNEFIINDSNNRIQSFTFVNATGSFYMAKYKKEELMKKVNNEEYLSLVEKKKAIIGLNYYEKFFLKLGSNGLISCSSFFDNKEYDIKKLTLPIFTEFEILNYYVSNKKEKNMYMNYLLQYL